MSYTTILAVSPNRRPAALLELRNSFGWLPSIWSRLAKHLYGFDGNLLHGPGERVLDRLWQEIEEQPEWAQAANVLTFDTGVIPYQAFAWAADQLEEFDRRLPAPEGHANHVPAVAALFRSEPEAPLIGVWGTSASENPFDPWDEAADNHGSGIPLYPRPDGPFMYVLERHRHLFPPREEADG